MAKLNWDRVRRERAFRNPDVTLESRRARPDDPNPKGRARKIKAKSRAGPRQAIQGKARRIARTQLSSKRVSPSQAVSYLRGLAGSAKRGGKVRFLADGKECSLILKGADGVVREFRGLQLRGSPAAGIDSVFGPQAPLYSAYSSLRTLPEKHWWPLRLRLESAPGGRVGLVWIETITPADVQAERGRVLLGGIRIQEGSRAATST